MFADELQLHSKESNLTPEAGINYEELSNETSQVAKKFKRLPFGLQPTKTLGRVPYYSSSNNLNKEIVANYDLLQGNQSEQLKRSEDQ